MKNPAMKYALIFPGQGSQQVGMGKALASAFPEANTVFEEANEILGFNLKKLCFDGPQETLTLTEHAQPAIVTVSTIAHRVLSKRVQLTPHSAAGHSVGEYSALVAAGALSFANAVRAVHMRGCFMQQATPPGVGAMAAVLGMEAEEVAVLCKEEAGEQVVCPANFNTPGQIVISGHAEAVARVLARARGRKLDVSAPFHSPLLEGAAVQMEEILRTLEFQDAAFPIMTNYANVFMRKAGEFASSLRMQIPSAVRWDTGIQNILTQGVDTLLELGWGKVLTGMMRRIDKTVVVCNVQDEPSLKKTLAHLQP